MLSLYHIVLLLRPDHNLKLFHNSIPPIEELGYITLHISVGRSIVKLFQLITGEPYSPLTWRDVGHDQEIFPIDIKIKGYDDDEVCQFHKLPHRH